jgi:PAS domain S-box-containing protein
MVVIYQCHTGQWTSRGWAAPQLDLLEEWKVPTVRDDAPIIELATKERFSPTGPLEGLAGEPPEGLSTILHTGLVISFHIRQRIDVAWLGFDKQPDFDRLQALTKVVESFTCSPTCAFKQFFTGMPALFIAVDRQGALQYCSQDIQRLGYESKSLAGSPASDLFVAGDWERLQSDLKRKAEVTRFQILMRHRAGQFVAMELLAVRAKESQGGWTMILANDLRQERQLGHFRRLEAVERLVSGVSHELNNPLQTVVGSAEMLAGMKLPESAQRRAQRVLSGAKRCQEVVNGLLKLKRSNRVLVEKVDLPKLVQRSLKRVEERFQPLKVSNRLNVDLDLPSVKGNEVDLQQALEHVLSNAFQAVIREQEPEIVISLRATGETVQISIYDNGPGFSPEIIDRAFEPFFTTRGVGAGKGLGLSIALGIIQEHGGSIEIQSGEGARVYIIIPVEGYRPF